MACNVQFASRLWNRGGDVRAGCLPNAGRTAEGELQLGTFHQRELSRDITGVPLVGTPFLLTPDSVGGILKTTILMTDQRQSQKEEAVLIALRNDMALIRRDLEVHGMKKDGSTEFISESDNYDDIWKDALEALRENH